MAEFDEKKHPRQKDGKFTNSNFFESAEETVNLSKREWAQYYETLGKIKSGNAYAEVTGKGNRMVIVENYLVFDNNCYVSPRVKKILKFNSEDELQDYLKSRRKK